MAIAQSRADFLRGVAIFSGLTEDMLAHVAACTNLSTVTAGDILFHQGEPGDALFVVRAGRLEVLAEEDDSKLIRTVGRGGVVGELSLLVDRPRSATVRARRDTELLALTRERFEELLRGQPEFALALTRSLGAIVAATRVPIAEPAAAPAVLALVPLHPDQRAIELAEALREPLEGDVAVLDGDPTLDSALVSREQVLDAAEHDHQHVLLVARRADEGRDSWMRFCTRQADRVLALAGSGPVPEWARKDLTLRGCELVFSLPDTPPDAEAWQTALEPRAIHLVRPGGSGADRIARRISGQGTAIALSGAGAGAFALLGAVLELAESGVSIDRVAGTGAGALLAGLLALELPADEIESRFRAAWSAGDAAAAAGRALGHASLEALPRGFACVSWDAERARERLHDRGSLAEAVAESMRRPRPGGAPPVEAVIRAGEGAAVAIDARDRASDIPEAALVIRPPIGTGGREDAVAAGREAARASLGSLG